jgi:RNA polymerase sigma-70 factor (ECF subfamily)
LLRQLRADDAAAWAGFYDSIAGDLRAYLSRLGARSPDDTLGEVMVQVVRSIRSFKGSDDELRPWAFGIARHRVLDEARRRSRRVVEAPLEDDDAVAPLASDPDPTALSEYLDLLTEDQREVVWLRFGLDFSLEETAQMVGKDPQAVAALSYRALQRLRKLLA